MPLSRPFFQRRQANIQDGDWFFTSLQQAIETNTTPQQEEQQREGNQQTNQQPNGRNNQERNPEDQPESSAAIDDHQQEQEPLVDWTEVTGAHTRIGPNLRNLRQEQALLPPSQRETYSLEHVQRLNMFRPNRPYQKPRANRLCSKVHPQPCQLACKSCHFCRQRTTELKTVCSRCEGVNTGLGGRGRGYWCGSCLWLRIGENIEEVRGRTDWVCPACRDICNCSGNNCLRITRGWFPTNQLIHEAQGMGYRSVAHYLILTHVSEAAAAAPMGDISHMMSRPMVRQRQEVVDGGVQEGGRPAKRRRMSSMVLEALQRAAATQRSGVLEELGEEGLATVIGGGGNAAAGGGGANNNNTHSNNQRQGNTLSGFTGILDFALQDDDDDDDAVVPSSLVVARSGNTAVSSSNDLDHQHNIASNSNNTGAVTVVVSSRSTLSFDEMFRVRHAPSISGHNRRMGEGGGGGGHRNATANADASLGQHLPTDGHMGGGGGGGGGAHMGLPGAGNDHIGGGNVVERRRVVVVQKPPALTDMLQENMMRLERGGGGIEMNGDDDVQQQQQRGRSVPSSGGGGGNVVRRRVVTSSPSHRHGNMDVIIEEEREEEQQQQQQQQQAAARHPPPVGGNGASLPQHQQHQVVITTTTTTTNPPPLSTPFTPTHPDDQWWRSLGNRALDVFKNLKEQYADLQATIASGNDDIEVQHAVYNEAYDEGMKALQDCLRLAESVIIEEVAVVGDNERGKKGENTTTNNNNQVSSAPPPPPPPPPPFFSYDGLRSAVSFFTNLGNLLPMEDVRWRVMRRLLGQEPFLNITLSDPKARSILVRGLIRLADTLLKRGAVEEAAQVAAGIADITGIVAKDLAAVVPLFRKLESSETTLPAIEATSIGPWTFDPSASLSDVFTQLHGLSADLLFLLMWSVKQLQGVCGQLKIDAGLVMTPTLVKATLAPESRLMKEPRLHSLSLVCSVLDAMSPKHDTSTSGGGDDTNAGVAMLTGEEVESRRRKREKMCGILTQHVIPALERLVCSEYKLWKSIVIGGNYGSSSINNNEDGEVDWGEESPAFHVGSEKVETLARCYAFLLECGATDWKHTESTILRPYLSTVYWRQMNAMYRSFAVFLLSHTLEHSPSVLSQQQQQLQHPHSLQVSIQDSNNITNILHTWFFSLIDTGRRQCMWYLTTILATHPSTSHLLHDITPEQLRTLLTDKSGDMRAMLVEKVFSRSPAAVTQSPLLVGEIDDVLMARVKEVQETSPNPAVAVPQWQATASKIVLAFISVLGNTYGTVPSSTMQYPPKIKAVLLRISNWAIAACGHIRSGGGGGGDGGDEEEDNSENGIKQRIKATSFGQLNMLWQVLIAAGAPLRFQSDTELLTPLVVIINGVAEIASGKVHPTNFDKAMLSTLAESLCMSQQQQGEGDRAVAIVGDPTSLSSKMHSLLVYVLGTVVRRLLEKATLNHERHQRNAVNALRLIQAVFDQPSMQCSPPDQAAAATEDARVRTHDALKVLLLPMLVIAIPPDSSQSPSIAAKDALYDVLIHLVDTQPTLIIPRFDDNNNGNNNNNNNDAAAVIQLVSTALGIFWKALIRDVLSTINSQVPPAQLPPLLKVAAQRAGPTSAWHTQYHQPTPLQPADQGCRVSAYNTLLGMLSGGRTRMDAVDAITTRLDTGINAITALRNNNTSTSAVSSNTATNAGQVVVLFRPGDFQWSMYKKGITMLVQLAKAGDDDGKRWAAAAWPPLLYVIVGAKQYTAPLKESELQLRNVLKEIIGVDAVSAVAKQRQQAEGGGGGNNNALAPAASSAAVPQSQHAPYSQATQPQPGVTGVTTANNNNNNNIAGSGRLSVLQSVIRSLAARHSKEAIKAAIGVVQRNGSWRNMDANELETEVLKHLDDSGS